jgi:hypothetical protein
MELVGARAGSKISFADNSRDNMKNELRYAAFAVIAGGLVACSHGKSDSTASTATTLSAAATPATAAAGTPTATPSATQGTVATAPTSAAPANPGNSTIEQATTETIGTPVNGTILSGGQKDFYRFDATSKIRDIAIVRLENKSSTLRPQFRIYDANRSEVNKTDDSTAGSSIQSNFTIEPGKTFYVSVASDFSSSGNYALSITPQKAYDSYEPNNDVLSAAPVAIGTPITGNVIDDKDARWFRITGATKKTIHVVFDNQSTTLKPEVMVFSSTKSQIADKDDGTAGANLDFTVDVEPGKDFYLQVFPYWKSTGKFKLTATEQ